MHVRVVNSYEAASDAVSVRVLSKLDLPTLTKSRIDKARQRIASFAQRTGLRTSGSR